jgi:phytoene/squalene synthetase
VARDLAIGRIYLPRADRIRFGYSESDLRSLRFTPEFAGLMKFEVERTRALFERGRPLVARVPREVAVDIDVFSRGGRAILDRIEARGYDVLSGRPSLSRWTKVVLLGRAIAGMGMARLRGTRSDIGRSPVSALAEIEKATARSEERP